jgi:DNA topoisomerase II
MNFFHFFWPKLLQPPTDRQLGGKDGATPFLSSFGTPLMKVSRKSSPKQILSFYSLAEYNDWRTTIEDSEIRKWSIKYYKGLGTSTAAEAKAYFAAFDDHYRPYVWRSEADGDCIDLAFDKKRASDRRSWILKEYDATISLSRHLTKANGVSFEQFVNKELIHFSHADCIRSIPSAIDGLKPSQRKVLFACFKRKLKSEMKVAQLAGYCSEQTAYHHGEAVRELFIVTC